MKVHKDRRTGYWHPVRVHQDILRFEVPVDETLRLYVAQRGEDLPAYEFCGRVVKAAIACNQSV